MDTSGPLDLVLDRSDQKSKRNPEPGVPGASAPGGYTSEATRLLAIRDPADDRRLWIRRGRLRRRRVAVQAAIGDRDTEDAPNQDAGNAGTFVADTRKAADAEGAEQQGENG